MQSKNFFLGMQDHTTGCNVLSILLLSNFSIGTSCLFRRVSLQDPHIPSNTCNTLSNATDSVASQYLSGDSEFHILVDTNGYTVIDDNGYSVYAELDEEKGELVWTGQHVGNGSSSTIAFENILPFEDTMKKSWVVSFVKKQLKKRGLCVLRCVCRAKTIFCVCRNIPQDVMY